MQTSKLFTWSCPTKYLNQTFHLMQQPTYSAPGIDEVQQYVVALYPTVVLSFHLLKKSLFTLRDRSCFQGRSRGNAQARASAVLHRRAVTTNASVRGQPPPFPLPGVRKTSNTFHGELLLSMPSPARMGAGSGLDGGRKSQGGVRRRGAVGAGELHKEAGGLGGVDKGAAKPSTFRRLWEEAKHETGHLTMAGVCLLLSSSANLMAPTILAK